MLHASRFFIFLAITTIVIVSCSRDSFEPREFDCPENVTFDNQIRPIIQSSCSYSGCHDGAGIGPLNYNSYEGMLPHLQSGSFENRVVNLVDDAILGMPPDIGVYEESIKSDLTEDEFTLMNCWLEAGFPEN